MAPDNQEKELTLLPVIQLILRNWKLISIVTIIGLLLSWIVCLFITPKYTSVVTVFPANLGSISHVVSTEQTGKKDFMSFGDEEELEQLLQLLHSDEIKSKITGEFDLFTHYNIDRTSRYPKTTLIKKYQSNVFIKKTRFMSIDIEVRDKNPEIAANIANRISELIDTVYKDIQRDRNQEALIIVQREYEVAREYINQIEDSLNKIRMKGINNYRAESEVYNAAYAEALSQGLTGGLKALQQKIDTLSKYGGGSLSLLGELELEQKRVALLKDRLIAAQVNANQVIPRKIVVNKAYPSEKPSYPIVWLIVVLSGLVFFVVSCFYIVITERFK